MSRTNATDVGDGECGLDGSSVVKTVRKAQKLRRFATSGAVTCLACLDRYCYDARWRIFNVLAWARPFVRFELLLFPDCCGECLVFQVSGTSQTKAQAIESGPGLRRSYQPPVAS